MNNILICAEGENSLNNTLKVLNTLSINYGKVVNPLLGQFNTKEFYIKFSINSEKELPTIQQILKSQKLTQTLTLSIKSGED